VVPLTSDRRLTVAKECKANAAATDLHEPPDLD
jgi:hypothetical protein